MWERCCALHGITAWRPAFVHKPHHTYSDMFDGSMRYRDVAANAKITKGIDHASAQKRALDNVEMNIDPVTGLSFERLVEIECDCGNPGTSLAYKIGCMRDIIDAATDMYDKRRTMLWRPSLDNPNILVRKVYPYSEGEMFIRPVDAPEGTPWERMGDVTDVKVKR